MVINKLAPNSTTRIFSPEGVIDLDTSPKLKAEIEQILDAGVKYLIINLSQVNYLDSSALGVLVSSLKRMQETNGNLILVNPVPHILRIFELTSLDRLFNICATNEEAIARVTLF